MPTPTLPCLHASFVGDVSSLPTPLRSLLCKSGMGGDMVTALARWLLDEQLSLFASGTMTDPATAARRGLVTPLVSALLALSYHADNAAALVEAGLLQCLAALLARGPAAEGVTGGVELLWNVVEAAPHARAALSRALPPLAALAARPSVRAAVAAEAAAAAATAAEPGDGAAAAAVANGGGEAAGPGPGSEAVGTGAAVMLTPRGGYASNGVTRDGRPTSGATSARPASGLDGTVAPGADARFTSRSESMASVASNGLSVGGRDGWSSTLCGEDAAALAAALAADAEVAEAEAAAAEGARARAEGEEEEPAAPPPDEPVVQRLADSLTSLLQVRLPQLARHSSRRAVLA
jgi:hypothetical protein